MNINKKILVILITVTIVFALEGCIKKSNKTFNTSTKVTKETERIEDKINLLKLKITYPLNWTKRGSENEIFFDDKSKQTIAGISLIGYYGDYRAALPNHSSIISSEDINTSLGKGKLFSLNRDNPAASDNNSTWNEIHVIIPTKNNGLAYDIWTCSQKDVLLDILKSIK